MPLLNWSPGALAALHDKGRREEMTRLFDAYFRVAGEKSHETLTGSILHLDLPKERNSLPIAVSRVSASSPAPGPRPGAPFRQPHEGRYHFYAKFTKDNGWVVQAALKPEHRVLSKAAELRPSPLHPDTTA